jgi:hypothetical protein
MTHFNLLGDIINATETAKFVNLIQERALQTRLGILIILLSNPRHAFTKNFSTGFNTSIFS